MKKSSALLFLFCFFYVFFHIFTANGFAKKPFKAEVTKIIDGDSLKVKDGRKYYEIRLYGIDAPEYDQPYAAEAKKLVKETILGKKVTVLPVEWDKYHRLVAIVNYKEQSINKRLLSRGLAWYYPKYCKLRMCKSWKREGKKAKKRGENIWSDPSSMAPWRWKYNKHKNK